MGITKKPGNIAAQPTLDNFIEAAPDGAKQVTQDHEESVQITLRMTRSQLERISKIAKRQGIPRASYIKRSIFIQLENDELGK